MALSALAGSNVNPNLLIERAVPLDVTLQFAQAQTMTASGYVNNVQTQVDMGAGRVDGFWALDLTALDLASGDETYRFFLLGSNDPTWTSGNIELLAAHDFAAAASGRLYPTVCAASPTAPITGKSATRHAIPYSNAMGGFVFRYAQLAAVIGGTTPSVTLSSWLSGRLF